MTVSFIDVGSQDWMKSALIARAAGVDYKAMRYVPFEGGGEAQTALPGGYIRDHEHTADRAVYAHAAVMVSTVFIIDFSGRQA